MKIREMDILVRVAETGSMSRAAHGLHITPAAVSAVVQRVERALDVRIFERTTRSLHLTQEGDVVLDGCRQMLRTWRRTLHDARSTRDQLEGTVHVSAPTDTALQVLDDVVVELSLAHPRLRVVLDASDRVQPLHREAIDLAIRYGALPDSSLTARRLSSQPNILVASPGYLDEFGVPDRVEDLRDHRCLTLHLQNVPQITWRLEGNDEVHDLTVESPLCGDGLLARRWAVRGMGIALKNLFDVVDDLEAGRLVRVLPAYVGGTGAIHAVYPSRRFQPARVQAVLDAVAERCADREERCRMWLNQRK